MKKSVSLGDIIDIAKGKKVDEVFSQMSEHANERFIQIDDLRNDNNLKYARAGGGLSVKKDDLVIAWDGANAGTVGHGLQGIIGSTLARLRTKSESINSKYLAKYLQSKFKYLRNQCTGATIPHINKAVLTSLRIPLPPLPEQKRIADILDKADSLRQKRKESIALLDELLKSVFIDMFGDPVRNEKGWEVRRLGEVCNIDRNQVLPEQIQANSNYVDLESIEKQTGEIVDFKNSDSMNIKSSKFRFTRNHILYGKLRPYLNKVASPDFDGICSTDILPIMPVARVSNKYFITFLMRHKSFVNYANDRSSGANLPRVNAETLNEYLCFLPPFSMQKRFADVVTKARLSKENLKQSQLLLDNLFNALLQRAFVGGSK